MFKSLIASLLFLSTAALAYPIGIPDVYEPLLPKAQVVEPALDDLMTPDEIAAELGIPTEEEQWANGNYEELLWNAARTKQNLNNRPLQILVTKSVQQMDVFLRGRHIATYLVTTGRNRKEVAKSGKTYFSATRPGTFTIDRMVKDHWSHTWKAPMPYSMFFNGGIAIHGTTPSHFEELGRPPGKYFINSKGKKQMAGSGSCVRLHPDNAKVLFNLVKEVGPQNVAITIVE